MAIGDGAELFATGSLGIRSDDNVLLANNAESDIIFDIAPGVDLTFGKGAQMQGSLTLVHTISSYADNSGLNTNLFTGDFLSRYDDGKLKIGLNASFHELNQNTVDVRPSLVGSTQGLIRRDVFSVGGNTEVEVSQLTSVGTGVQFAHENYRRAGFTDSDSLTVPVNFYYKWTPKTDISVGYRYRDYHVDLGRDSTDHFFNIGARGEFTPKLTGTFAVGLNTRDIKGANDRSELGLDARFAYEISPKTSLDFGGSKDFGTGARGEQQRNTTLNALVSTRISEEWSVNGGLNWRAINYGPRTDDYYEGQLGTTYIVNANVRILGTYMHRKYDSDVRLNEFKNNVFSISANFRY